MPDVTSTKILVADGSNILNGDGSLVEVEDQLQSKHIQEKFKQAKFISVIKGKIYGNKIIPYKMKKKVSIDINYLSDLRLVKKYLRK